MTAPSNRLIPTPTSPRHYRSDDTGEPDAESRTSGSGEGRRKSAPVTRGNSPAPIQRTWRASRGFSSSHLVPKWKREVEMTVPGVRGHRRVHHRPGAAAPLHRLRPPLRGDEPGEGQAVLPLDARRTSGGPSLREGSCGRRDGGALPGPLLPRLHGADRGQGRGTAHDLNRRKHTCAACAAPLWQADRSGPSRYPLADYIKHRMKGFFEGRR